MRRLALLFFAACSSSTIFPDAPRTADAAPADVPHVDAGRADAGATANASPASKNATSDPVAISATPYAK